MRHLVTTLLSLVCVTAFGQSLKREPFNINQHRAMLSYLLRQQQPVMAAKTTSYHERVIAQSTRGNDALFITPDSLVDSVSVAYTDSRNSIFDFNMMQYFYGYPYNNTPYFNFNDLHASPLVQYDTMYRWTLYPDLSTGLLKYTFFEAAYGNYSVTNKLVNYRELYADSTNIPNMSYVNTFDVAGRQLNGYWFKLVSGVPDSAYVQLFSYNGAGKLVEDSIFIKRSGSWSMVAKTYYTYTGLNLTQIDCFEDSVAPLREKLKYENTYDVATRLHTVLTSEFDGTNLVAYAKDTFDYTGSLIYHTAWHEHRWDGINSYWAPVWYMHKHINASMLPDTVFNMTFDSLANAWAPHDKQDVVYDTARNPIKLTQYTYYAGDYLATPASISHYYYQQYTGASVPTTVTNNDNMVVYPNPANDKIWITQTGNPATGMLSVSIINTNGQLVRSMYTPGQNKIEVPMQDLTPGLYSIVINNAAGSILHQQTIIKQ